MLPRPESRALFALTEHAVFFLCVDKRDVTLVRLGLLIEKIEDALCSRKSHDNGVDLMRNLIDVARELLCHVEERNDDADADGVSRKAEVVNTRDEKRTAADRDYNIEYVADVVEYRSESVCVFVGLLRFGKEPVVETVKIGLALFLVTENLDDLLSVHDLLDKAFNLAESRLLTEEILGRASADFLDKNGHQSHAADDHDGKPAAVIDHDAEYRHDGYARHYELRNTLRYHLTQGVDIVCVVTHYVAVVVGVEIPDGKSLHTAEHLLAHFLERTLSDDRHHLVPRETCDKGQQIEYGKNDDKLYYLAAHSAPVAALPASLDYRNDVLHEYRGDRADRSAENYAGKGEGEKYGVELEHHFYKAADRAFLCSVLFHLLAPSLFWEV